VTERIPPFGSDSSLGAVRELRAPAPIKSIPILKSVEFFLLYLTAPPFLRKLPLFTGARSSTG